MTLLVISPHLDDAVLSASGLLDAHPGSTVLTVFAGTPLDSASSTEWDRACGFGSASEAMAARRQEDRLALRELNAVPLWLDFIDGQYSEPVAQAALIRSIASVIESMPEAVVAIPFGLWHPDHQRASDAALDALLATRSSGPIYVWEDVPYRALADAVVQRREALQRRGFALERWQAAPHSSRSKREALEHYASQMPRLRDDPTLSATDIDAPETYWRLKLPAGGMTSIT